MHTWERGDKMRRRIAGQEDQCWHVVMNRARGEGASTRAGPCAALHMDMPVTSTHAQIAIAGINVRGWAE